MHITLFDARDDAIGRSCAAEGLQPAAIGKACTARGRQRYYQCTIACLWAIEMAGVLQADLNAKSQQVDRLEKQVAELEVHCQQLQLHCDATSKTNSPKSSQKVAKLEDELKKCVLFLPVCSCNVCAFCIYIIDMRW